MKIKFNKHLLHTAIQYSFATLTATAAITLVVSPNLVQAIDGYIDDGYTTTDNNNATHAETPAQVAYVEQQESEQKAVSTAILTKTVNTTVRTTTSHIKSLSARNRQFSIANAGYAQYSTSGLNAGNAVSGMAGWLTIPYSNFEDNSFSNINSNFDGHSINYLAGMDFVINTQIAVGASIGYENSDIKFNNSDSTDTKGWFGTLYGAYNFPELTAYLLAGYGTGENSPTAANSYDSQSNFVTAGAMKDFELDTNVSLNLDASYTYAESESDSYASRGLIVSPGRTILSQININAEIANILSWGEVYGLAESKFDLYDDDNALHDNGKFAMDLGVGVRFKPAEAIFGDINVKKMFARKDEENVTISATIRYQF